MCQPADKKNQLISTCNKEIKGRLNILLDQDNDDGLLLSRIKEVIEDVLNTHLPAYHFMVRVLLDPDTNKMHFQFEMQEEMDDEADV